MKTFIIIAVVAAVAFAAPHDGSVDFTEDTLGNYNLQYETKDSSRREQRFEDGKVIGSYSFTDTDGKKHFVNYVAAKNEGFIAAGAGIPVASNDLPVQVQDTHEVAYARSEHLALVAKEKALHEEYRRF